LDLGGEDGGQEPELRGGRIKGLTGEIGGWKAAGKWLENGWLFFHVRLTLNGSDPGV
jgi:hypothetical protein